MVAFAAWHALKGRVEYPLTFQVPRMLRKLVDEVQDTYCLFWNDRHLWKRERWPAYRDRPEIWDHAGDGDFEAMLEVLTALGAVQYRAEGREADELLAAVAHTLEGTEPVVIRSDDKDFMQLLSPTTAMHGRVRGAVRVDDVEEILGVPAPFVADYLALTGDKADGIPRIVTPVPARKLLAVHGHVRDWPAGGPPGSGRAIDAVRAQFDQLRLNLELVDLSPDAVGDPPSPVLAGWDDPERARAVGKRINISALADERVGDEFEVLRRWGAASRKRLETG